MGRAAAFLVALVAASAGGASDAALATEPPPRERVAKVACYEPHEGAWGLRKVSRCARIQKIRRLPNGVWWVQLRRPPVYCYEVHLDRFGGDVRADVPGVGFVDEVRCPASAYANEGKPDVRVPIRGFASESRHRWHGFVSLTAVNSRRTRIVVEVAGDFAWLVPDYCGERPGKGSRKLAEFYSLRSTTLVPVSLGSLLARPHSVVYDAGGAHGGEPLGCANLVRR